MIWSSITVSFVSGAVSIICLLVIVLINLLLWYWRNHVRFIRGAACLYKSRSTQTVSGSHEAIQEIYEVGDNSAHLDTQTDDQSPYAELHAPDIGLSSHYISLDLGSATLDRSSREVTQESVE